MPETPQVSVELVAIALVGSLRAFQLQDNAEPPDPQRVRIGHVTIPPGPQAMQGPEAAWWAIVQRDQRSRCPRSQRVSELTEGPKLGAQRHPSEP